MSEAPTPAQQEFLAMLVHRGFLERDHALKILHGVAEHGFQGAISAVTGWDAKKTAFLQKTKGLAEPELPGYTIERKLGAGGTSEVFGAKRDKDFARVALKILLPKLAQDAVAVRRFLAEAKTLSELKVSSVVKGHRVFRFLGTYVLEMDWVTGRTLEEYLAEGESFGEKRALDVVLQAARALEEMRAAGLVHRDLKPGNIMISKEGKVTLIDLGFAGAGMEGRHDSESTLGTPAYLAPEQARGEDDLDARADIYSLGATLYHLVIGKLPFQAGDDQEMLRKQVLEGLSGAALKGGDVSPSLHYFIEKMMAKDRESRYANASELIEDIEAHMKSQAGW